METVLCQRQCQETFGLTMNKIVTPLIALLLATPIAAAASEGKFPSAKFGSFKPSGYTDRDDRYREGKRRDDRRRDDRYENHKPDKLCKGKHGAKSKCAGGGSDSR